MPAMKLPELPEDALLAIVSSCSAQDVLNLSQTSSCLRTFLLSPLKQLWLRLVEELDEFSEFCYSDRWNAPPPSELSSNELHNLVLKAHRARCNWGRNNGPRATRAQRVLLQNRGGYFGSILGTRGDWSRPQPRNGIKFVRGCDGRYITLIWSSGYLQICDIQQGKDVWTYPRLGDFANDIVVACDSEALHSGDGYRALTITFLTRTRSTPPRTILRQWILDLCTLRAHEARYITCPYNFTQVIDMGCCTSAFWIESGSMEFARKYVYFIDWNLFVNQPLFGFYPSNPAIIVNDSYVSVAAEADSTSLYIYVFDFRNSYRHDGSSGIRLRLANQTPETSPRSKSEACQAFLMFPMQNDLKVHDFALWSPRTTDNSDSATRLYVIASMTSKSRPDHSVFVVYEVFIVVDREHTFAGQKSSLKPIITATQRTCRLIRPFAHMYVEEFIMAVGRGGRGLLASKNKQSKKMRCYAISVGQMLQASDSHQRECRSGRTCKDECFVDLGPLAPVRFGNDLIAPGAVYLEHRTGAVVFSRDNPKTGDTNELVIQSYD